jgi:AraC-like DNA-binding protein/mannose-6-phosphate isomerase-like protein (cupin superfamily)
MSVDICRSEVDLKQHEMKNHGTPMFPCGGYKTEISGSKTQFIPWHWHEEFEVIYVKSGRLKLDIPQQSLLIAAGEAAFLNANILHTATNESDVCEIRTLVFSPRLLFGDLESAIEQKYVRPLIACRELAMIHFLADEGNSDCIKTAFEIYEEQMYGYEILVRNCLSGLLWFITWKHKDMFLKQQKEKDIAIARTKAMLSYIDAHFKEAIAIEDIAGAAAVSGREALRCFNKALGTTPMKYLLRYRVAIAAGMLATSDASITEICQLSGFESPSYFALKFKELTGSTPSDYRRGEK